MAPAQIDQKPENAPLTESERIIVPRYLVPMAAPIPVADRALIGVERTG